MTTQSIKDLNHYVMKSDISEDHVNVLSTLFRSLCKANQQGVLFDHTGDDPNIMTLDLDQVRHAMREYSGKLITNMEIIDALYDLHMPRLLPNSVRISREGNNGHRIMPVRLDYSQPESPDNKPPSYSQIFNIYDKWSPRNKNMRLPMMPMSDLGRPYEMQETIDSSVEVFQRLNAALRKHNEELKSDADSCTKMSTEDELDKCDASRRWVDHAMKLEKQNAELQRRLDNQRQTIENLRSSGKEKISALKEERDIEQMTISRLRSIITELSEVLYEVDADARISITSSDVLELMQSNCDTPDTPF